MDTTSPYISVAEAGRRLGVGPAAVRDLIDRGELAGLRVGRLWRIEATEVDRFIRENTTARNAVAS